MVRIHRPVARLSVPLPKEVGPAGLHPGEAVSPEASDDKENLSMLIRRERINQAACERWGLPRATDLVIETAHPSPLSARRGFFGSRPFSRVNDWLRARDDMPIDWALSQVPTAG